jgi:hypothetical protein
VKVVVLLFSFLLPVSALAFPELTRYGYNSCIACHVSPSGGGLLTSYGRSLSSEVLSTWGTEKDGGLFWRAVDREAIEKYLLVGGDVRGVQVHHENSNVKDGRFIYMQSDMEFGFNQDHWGGAIAIGQVQNDVWKPFARSYYAFWRPRDELTIRAGRFFPSYGLRLPDHIAFTRSFLGFGLDGIRDGVEVQWTGETWTFNLTEAKQFATPSSETATSAQAQFFFSDRSKVGANIWSGRSDSMNRLLTGIWGILGFTKNLYFLSEIDHQTKASGGTDTRSIVIFNRLGYTVLKGLDVFLQNEILHADLSVDSSNTDRNGLGLQFYPLPHFEFSGIWTKQKSTAPGSLEEDYAWLLMHYYF